MKVEVLERIFTYNGTRLPDPNPDFSVEQVRDMYVNSHPELATAAVEGPEATSRGLEFKFVRAVGAKG
jgi:PRTRC genetic system protein C